MTAIARLDAPAAWAVAIATDLLDALRAASAATTILMVRPDVPAVLEAMVASGRPAALAVLAVGTATDRQDELERIATALQAAPVALEMTTAMVLGALEEVWLPTQIAILVVLRTARELLEAQDMATSPPIMAAPATTVSMLEDVVKMLADIC